MDLPSPSPSHRVLEQAAEWYALVRMGSAGEQDRAGWHAWLQAAPEHRTAWDQVEEISRSFAPLQALPAVRLATDKLLQADVRTRQRRRMLAALAGLVGAGALGWTAWRDPAVSGTVLAWNADQRSVVGQQRDVALPDGTRVWLNTGSAFNVDFSGSLRRIALVTGEIFVATAADARPLVVDTAQGRLRAFDTRFDVRQDDARTLVAVYEGAVEIRPAAQPLAAVLQAGRQARFTRERIDPSEAADMAREAWTRGLLAAHDISLRELVRELRRYRPGHIGLSEEVAELRVVGSFPARDTDRALAMLATALPIRIRQTLPWWISIEPRS